jgi:hypothetical protein
VRPIPGPRCRERQQRPVGEGRRDERDPEGQPVVAARSGHGDRREVEQVDEVGVCPQPRVGGDRLGGHLGVGGEGGRRGDHQGVEPGERLLGVAVQLGEAVLTGERVDGREARAATDHRADGGIGAHVVALQEGSDGGVALGQPWAVVEEGRRLEERLEVDLDDLVGQRLGTLARPQPRAL